MNIKEKLQQILLETDQRLKDHPNVLGLPDHPGVYNYLVAKIESVVDFLEYEDVFLEGLRSVLKRK